MKALHEKVNIVPVLAKADTLTPNEVKKKKFKASAQAIESLCLCRGLIFGFKPLLVTDSRGDRAIWNQNLPVSRL